jgi:hypothetical protein
VLSTTTLLGLDGEPFPAQSLDPEGMTLTPQHTLVVTSEGISSRGSRHSCASSPSPARSCVTCRCRSYFDPTDPSVGVRNNLGFEAAAVTPDGQRLVVGTENALVQDGPAATTTTTSPARILSYHIGHGGSDREYVYDTDPVVAPSSVFTVNGLVELLPLNQQFVAMERSFSVGVGNDIRIYRVALPGATNVSGVADLHDVERPPAGAEVTAAPPAGHRRQPLDNVEGMTLGPLLPDGRRAVLMVSDNNFTPGQDSQVLLAALSRSLGWAMSAAVVPSRVARRGPSAWDLPRLGAVGDRVAVRPVPARLPRARGAAAAPVVLARFAARHVAAGIEAARLGSPPPGTTCVTWSTPRRSRRGGRLGAGGRAAGTRERAVALVEEALRGRRFRARL